MLSVHCTSGHENISSTYIRRGGSELMLNLFTCSPGINEMNGSGNCVANGQANNVVIVQKHVNPRINPNNDETEDDSEDDMYEDDDMDILYAVNR